MRKASLVLTCAALLLVTTSALAYNGGNGDEDMPAAGGCSNAMGCHGTASGNSIISLVAVADDGTWNTPGEPGTFTATVNIDAANSDAGIAGVMLLDPVLSDNLKASGWTIIQDPNSNSTPYNYNEMVSLTGNTDFTWNVTAPDSVGTYRAVARLMFDDGGPRHSHSDTVEMTFAVGVSELSVNAGRPSSPKVVNNPNPFVYSTKIMFQLSRTSTTSLKIYDSGGRLARTLVDGQVAAGRHAVPWDGTNSQGRKLAAGIYFYVLRTEDDVSSGKAVVLR